MQGSYLGSYPWKDGGILTAADLNAAIGTAESLAGNAVQRLGDTMTGTLVINKNLTPVPPAVSATALLQLKGADGNPAEINLNAFSNNIAGAAPSIQLGAANGTGATPLPLRSGNFLGALDYIGYAPGGWTSNRVAVNALANEDWTATNQGTRLTIQTTPLGSTTLTAVLTAAQGVTIGNPAGGDRGAGSINAQAIYVNNQPIGAQTGGVPITGGTMTGPLVINLNTAPAQPPMAGTNLQLSGADGTITRLEVDSYNGGNAGNSSNITLRSTRGTAAAPAALQTNDVIGGMVFRGWNGTGYSAANRATVNCVAAENWGTVAPAGEGTRLLIGTTAVGATILTTRLTIGPGLQVGAPTSGDMGAGTINAQAVYVQGVAVAAGGLGGAVPLVGGTMTGTLGINLNAASLAVTGLGVPLIHTAGADNTPAPIVLDAYTTAGNTATINFRMAAGTAANPATVNPTNAMNLGALRFYGYDATVGSFESLGPAARISAVVNGPWTNTSHPTRFDFSVAQPGSTGVATSPGMTLAQGLVVGGPSGGAAGDMGFGSINAQAVYVNGLPLAGLGAVTVTTSSYSLNVTGIGRIYVAFNGAATITLVPAMMVNGQEIVIMDTGGFCSPTNTITVLPGGSANINGQPSAILNTAYGRLRLIFNGTNYVVC
jgi:hypothetical protein